MIQIAGTKTDVDWRLLESKIIADFSNEALWHNALDFFEVRLNERYINPAKEIQNNLGMSGEGFAITTILCSLVETLETFHEGQCYKSEKPIGTNEYGNGKSESIFISFLSKRSPFSNIFTEPLAKDFYKNVRCALLHEAMTRNGWIIRAKINTNELLEQGNGTKILNRLYFLKLTEEYIKQYRHQVLNSKDRKDAFIRKMDCICKNI